MFSLFTLILFVAIILMFTLNPRHPLSITFAAIWFVFYIFFMILLVILFVSRIERAMLNCYNSHIHISDIENNIDTMGEVFDYDLMQVTVKHSLLSIISIISTLFFEMLCGVIYGIWCKSFFHGTSCIICRLFDYAICIFILLSDKTGTYYDYFVLGLIEDVKTQNYK